MGLQTAWIIDKRVHHLLEKRAAFCSGDPERIKAILSVLEAQGCNEHEV